MSTSVLQRRYLGDLVWSTVRVLPWGQLLGVGLLAVLLGAFVTADAYLPVGLAVDRVRLLMPLFAVAVAAVLDDPTRPHLDTVPVRLAVRQGLRLFLSLPIVAVWWLALVVTARSRLTGSPADGADLPVAALTVVLWALVALALATAALVTRWRGGHGGLPAAGVALVVPTVLAGFEPMRERWFPPHPSTVFDRSLDELWWAAHQRWAVVAVAASAVLLWSLRDPVRPALPWRAVRPPDRSRPPGSASPHHPATLPSGGTTR